MNSQLSGALRRALLLKIISKHQPTRDDVNALIELTASKVVEALEAQSMTYFLVEGGQIRFKHVYYSPSLWAFEPTKQDEFHEKRKKLLETSLPLGTGVVGQVIAEGASRFYDRDKNRDALHNLAAQTGFTVSSMLTVPLKGTNQSIGAIQVLNKEPGAVADRFSENDRALIEEIAEYSAPIIQRMLDPGYRISDFDTAKFAARFTDNPLVTSLEDIEIDRELFDRVGENIIQRNGILPTHLVGDDEIAVLLVNPLDYAGRENFETATGLTIAEVSVAPRSLIDEALGRDPGSSASSLSPDDDGGVNELADAIGFEFGRGGMDDDDAENQDEDSAPIIQLANKIIADAYRSGASDIHIEPQETDLIVRYRVDGVCSEKLRLPKMVANALVARIKVMSQLDITEKRLPQDGRIVFRKFSREHPDIDLRVAVGPMNHGEKVVLRILDKTRSALPITSLGFSEENLEQYRKVIRQPYGMILHTGPTGSGKSMTLFSALREVASPKVNILTAEDPIEYTIPGINQMQMHRTIGLTFAAALRCYLRMDPDIILVGEIRDRETAEIAVEAALTGHLLLSTLHTNDAPSSIARLTEIGIEPFMVSASLLAVCAQRLMRRVCKHCRISYTPEGNESEILAHALGGWHGEIFRASEGGCPNCSHTGFRGRIGIHELMLGTPELGRAINTGADTAELRRIAVHAGMKTLHADSILKVREGHSTILEALATVPPDHR